MTSEEVKNSGERRMKGHPGFTVLFERRIFQLPRRFKLDTQRFRTTTIPQLSGEEMSILLTLVYLFLYEPYSST